MPETHEFDELWPGTRFVRSADGFRLGTDSVLLAAFTGGSGRVRRFADLGCGSGVLTVLLLQKLPESTAFGIELQPEAAALCRRNLAANGLETRAEILTGDLRGRAALPPAGSFDLVVSNPPYFAAGTGFTAPDERRAAAREERFCTLRDVCEAAAYLTRWGGVFTVVHRAERLSELFCTLTACGLEPKRLRTVARTLADAPTLVLVEAKRGGKPGLAVEPPLPLCAPEGGDSGLVRKIYHRRGFL